MKRRKPFIDKAATCLTAAVVLFLQVGPAALADDPNVLIPETATADMSQPGTNDSATKDTPQPASNDSAPVPQLHGGVRKHDRSLQSSADESPPHELGVSDNSTNLQSEKSSSDKAKTPLQGRAAKNSSGVRSLPEGLQPDEIIGHFYLTYAFFKIAVNGPIGATAGFAYKLQKKWHGKMIRSCEVHFTKIQDGSGGFYFATLGHRNGPRGWIMPMPKKPDDKKTPWGIYFDQPDAPIANQQSNEQPNKT